MKLNALMSSNYHFHKLNVASAEYQFGPATPITNTIQCKLYVSQVKSPFTFYIIILFLFFFIINLFCQAYNKEHNIIQ